MNIPRLVTEPDLETEEGSDLEQVGMGAGALENDLVIGEFVDQQPVGSDVAFARALSFTGQPVIAIPLRKLLAFA